MGVHYENAEETLQLLVFRLVQEAEVHLSRFEAKLKAVT